MILEGYNQNIGQGWDEVLVFIKQSIAKLPLNPRVVVYYRHGEKEKVKRRIKRIVNEAVQEASTKMKLEATFRNEAKKNVAEETVKRNMLYAEKRTPLERKEDKMAHFKDTKDNLSRDDDEEGTVPPPKKKSLKEKSEDAQEAHQKMCQQAMASIEMMNKVRIKLSNKLDDM